MNQFPAPVVNARADLALAIENMKKRGIISKSTVVSPSALKVKVTLENNKSNYRFDIQAASGQAADEIKLDINDSFFCTHIGFYLVAENTAGNLNVPYQTYPNEVVFANTGTVADLEAIYKGTLDVKVQSTVVYEDIDLQRFRAVPQTQQTAATDRSQQDPYQGLMELTPNLFLNGRASNEINVNLPTQGGVDWAGTTTFENKIVFVALGFLAKNVSFSREG